MEAFLHYLIRISPGTTLGVIFLLLLPRSLSSVRIGIYLALFILFRDAMAPAGIWSIGVSSALYLRFPSPSLLPAMTLACGALVALMQLCEPELRKLVVWKSGSAPKALLTGACAAVAIALPSFVITRQIPIAERGGAVEPGAMALIFLFSFVGNLYEELLFRGYLQGYLEKHVTPARAATLSGVAFGFGHIFLATTVTSVGWPILAFALYEGLICAEVRRRNGLLASTIAHGGGIFFLASGLA